MSLVVSPTSPIKVKSPAYYMVFDAGGTKITGSVFEAAENGDVVVCREPLFTNTVSSGNYSRFDEGVSHLLSMAADNGYSEIKGLGLGVAGPVNEGTKTVRFSNREEWGVIPFQDLADTVGVPLVVVNDVEAWGNYLYFGARSEDVVIVKGGIPRGQVQAVGAPGTGNNISIADLEKSEPTPSEFGQFALPAISREDLDLLEYLFAKNSGGQPCIEDVVSGPGLVNIYNFLVEQHGAEKAKAKASDLWERDPALAIAQAAENLSCPLAVRAFQIYTKYLGAYTALISLATGARNRIFLGGNARKDAIRIHWNIGHFIDGLTAARKIPDPAVLPVDIIMNPQAPLIGTAFRTSVKIKEAQTET